MERSGNVPDNDVTTNPLSSTGVPTVPLGGHRSANAFVYMRCIIYNSESSLFPLHGKITFHSYSRVCNQDPDEELTNIAQRCCWPKAWVITPARVPEGGRRTRKFLNIMSMTSGGRPTSVFTAWSRSWISKAASDIT